MVELARLAETLNFDSIWIPETWGVDAVSVLAVLARETTRIRLASGVFNVFSRSAGLIAQTAATLHSLSGGRFILGLGASGPLVVENWHGLPFVHPVQRTRDYIDAIRLALHGSRVDLDASILQLRGFRLSNPPQDAVPIYVAALGPRNVRLAASIADGWLPIFTPLRGLSDLVDSFSEAASSAGRRADLLDVAAYIPAAVGDRAGSLLRQQLAYYIGGMGTYYASFLSRQGFQTEVGEIRHYWALGKRLEAVRAVSSDLLDNCTLRGESSGTLARTLDGYRSAGIRLPIASVPHGSSAVEVADLLRTLAPSIRPHH